MLLFDYQCSLCGVIFERLVCDKDKEKQQCDCGGDASRIWIKAPASSLIGPEGSDMHIKAMQKSFRERFVKKDRDDLLHKHGSDFSDSLRCGAIDKIKKGLHEKNS